MENGNNLIHSFQHNETHEGSFNGLTKREYFAGLAMQSLIAGRELSLSKEEADLFASQAIQFANSLLEKLEQPRNNA